MLSGLFNKKKKETQEQEIQKFMRTQAGVLTFEKIIQRMKDRPIRWAAKLRQLRRNRIRVKMLIPHKRMGIVRDEDFGEKPPRMGYCEARARFCR